ncbi:hypothetical protein [Helicobacter cinaedi]|uniref:hypothetical protein n=1 Tax=Helicobacter cinaedi TaxID=213 RepID=UPI000E0E5FD6|nr:hypothetical protein [Helicobacter cinaedi]
MPFLFFPFIQSSQGEVFCDDFGSCEAFCAETSHKGCRTNKKQTLPKAHKRQADNYSNPKGD